MTRRLFHKMKKLSWADWGALLKGGVLVVLVRAALVFVRFRTLSRFLDRSAERLSRRDTKKATFPERDVWAVRVVAGRLLPRRPCLTQALAVYFLLRRRGYAPQLQIGVTKEEETLRAHAWVESDGEIVIGGELSPQLYTQLKQTEVKQPR